MRKSEWKRAAQQAERRADIQAARVAELETTLADMRTHWRPVPITHPWQPTNPQCALCDEPRDSPRHTTTGPLDQPA